ncbi:MAG TPA: STAS/SEC14 domain-containing protein [Candidatus Acidoferrum sp.]|nr:STAS/SEC14 domain-containing protein [Candidatus Acidoferrum sp.]
MAVVKWDPESQAVYTEWRGWANPSEFKAVLEAGIAALKEHRGSRGLSDTRLQKAIQQSDQEWIDRDWFPRAMAAGLNRVAIVVAQSVLVQMNIERVLTTAPSAKLDVEHFATVDAARKWLRQPSAT